MSVEDRRGWELLEAGDACHAREDVHVDGDVGGLVGSAVQDGVDGGESVAAGIVEGGY